MSENKKSTKWKMTLVASAVLAVAAWAGYSSLAPKEDAPVAAAMQAPVTQTASQPAPSVAPSANGLPSLAPMLERVRPAVVSINVEGETASQQLALPEEFAFLFGDAFGQSSGSQPFRSLGSGVIINAEKGYVLTNNHVIENAKKINVKLEDGREFNATVLGTDAQTDIALLRLDNPSNLVAIQFANSDQLRVGDYAVAIGNPFGLGQTVTSGIISALGRSTNDGSEGYQSYIQTDAAVNQGNSGGPLINLNGELIGINTAIISPSGGNAGIAFAIPSNMANNLVQQIVQYGAVQRGVLGITGGEVTAEMVKALNLSVQKGAFVNEVVAGSAAANAGLKAGDVITEFNGLPISSFADLRAKIATAGAGKEVELTFVRGTASQKVKVVLQAATNQAAQASESRYLQGTRLSETPIEGGNGILVAEVERGSLAEVRGLRKGDIIVGVNNQRVASIAELKQTLEQDRPVVALDVLRGGSRAYIFMK